MSGTIDDKISNELNYRPINLSKPKYTYNRIFQQSGGTQFQNTTGGTQTILEIPANTPFNLARSWLQFTYTTGASGTDTLYNYTFADFIPFFRQVQFFTKSGVKLMDLDQFHRFAKMTQKINLKYKKFIDNGSNSNATTAIWTNSSCYPSNELVGVGAAATGNIQNFRYDGTAAYYNYNEVQYLEVTAANTAVTKNVFFRFEDFPDCILGLDKDLLFNETMLLIVTWNPIANISYIAGAANLYTPATNAAPPVGNNTAVSITANPNITTLELHLAIERNPEIKALLQERLNSSGLTLQINYPWMFINNNTGGSQGVSIRLNGYNGSHCKRIYHSCFGTTASLWLADYDNSNINTNTLAIGSKVTSFYTQLDGQKINFYDYNCASYDDYYAIKYLLEDTPIMNQNVHYYNWVWVEDFEDGRNSSNDVIGIELNTERKWDFFGTMGGTGSINHVDFAICKKTLSIASSGVVVV